jgi:hypothetical protein
MLGSVGFSAGLASFFTVFFFAGFPSTVDGDNKYLTTKPTTAANKT